MDIGLLLATLSTGALTAGLAGLLGALIQLRRSMQAARSAKIHIPSSTLDEKIKQLAGLSTQLQRLGREVEAEVELRRVETERLTKEAETASAKAKAHAAASKALDDLVEAKMETVLARSEQRGFWKSFWVQALFTFIGFVLGVGGSALAKALGVI